MFFCLLFFCVLILCVNRSRSSFILYRIVKRHSRQSNVRRIWTCADNDIDAKQNCQRSGSNDELCRPGRHFGTLSVDFVVDHSLSIWK